MIIRIEGQNAERVAAAQRELELLAHRWGHEIHVRVADNGSPAQAAHDNEKVIDPATLITLALSIPPAALAVLDISDRIQKRRRARKLIDHTQHLVTQHITVNLILQNRTIDLATLDPDQLLDLVAADDDPSTDQANR